MRRPLWLVLGVLLMGPLWAAEDTAAPAPAPATPEVELESENEEPGMHMPEPEENGIIPKHGNIYASTQTVTPVSVFPETRAYDQAKQELARAQQLFKNGDYEASSDIALLAYDDLMELRRMRGKKQRKKLRQERRQAATVYVEASCAYIKEYVKGRASTNAAVEEGLGRLEDLRSVARDYDDLRLKVARTAEAISNLKK